MRSLILATFVGLLYCASWCDAAYAKPMPLQFCRELRGLPLHSAAYRDTLDACRWDYAHPRRR